MIVGTAHGVPVGNEIPAAVLILSVVLLQQDETNTAVEVVI
jgi:hypothetical protein